LKKEAKNFCFCWQHLCPLVELIGRRNLQKYFASFGDEDAFQHLTVLQRKLINNQFEVFKQIKITDYFYQISFIHWRYCR